MNRKKPGTVRIIGGRWRGRRLPVADAPGLRPSGDRSRETLFNWLQPFIPGACCADLFAGTGVLGIEAASRGAEQVILIEKARETAQMLRENLDLLMKNDPKDILVKEADALGWLATCDRQSLDIIFVDPPFGLGLELAVLERLSVQECLAPSGLVYVETARKDVTFIPGSGWEILKEKLVGDVRMQLLKKI